MLTPVQEQFFVLLRAALWDRPVNFAELGSPVDWKQIYILSRKQTVTGLIADAISTLPEGMRPPKPILQRFIRHKLAIEYNNQHLNTVLNDVVRALNEHQIPHILLKGQGIALNYPHPASRTCGDIDLYVGKKYYKEACDVINALSETPNVIVIENDKHYSQKVHGVDIEIHQVVTVVYNPFVKKEFQKFTIESLDNNFFPYPGNGNIEHWNLNGTIINLPQVDFATIFLLIHPYHHLIETGIGLRQLCDFALYLDKHENKINKTKVEQELKALDLCKAWSGFTTILHQYLDLPLEKIPVIMKIDEKLADKIMKEIFIGGNFGHYNKKNKNADNSSFIKRKLKNIGQHMNYSFKMFSLFPKISFFFIFEWIKTGLLSSIMELRG